MLRVGHNLKCPLCGSSSWCLLSVDGKYVTCKRSKNGALGDFGKLGYLHKLDVPIKIDAIEREAPKNVQWITLQQSYQVQLSSFPVLPGIERERTYRQYFIGWNGKGWTFPVWNERLQITGMQVRYMDGFRCSVEGTRLGAFVPGNIKRHKGLIAVTEGMTDAMALFELGLPAVGKWNWEGPDEIIVALMGLTLKPKGVVIFADNDPDNKQGNVGQRGASNLQKMFKLYAPAIKTKIISPPAPYKDFRDWKIGTKMSTTDLQGHIFKTRKGK